MLEVKHLSKTYSSGFKLNDISLHLEKGDFVLLFGEDDAGKTALIYQILGLHHSRSGQILLDGKSVKALTMQERKCIQYVPDSVCMEKVTAREYFSTLSKLYLDYQEEDVADLCEYFGIDVDVMLTDMTYNENKLVMIIGAMVTMPKVLILDEPLNFLTAESAKKLLGFLKFLSSRGVAILITSEEAKDVWEYCNRYVRMSGGAIVSQGNMVDYLGVQKAITIGAIDAIRAQELLGDPIAKSNHKMTFLYNKEKQTKSLADILDLLKVSDIEIENLTLEEMLDEDYTRWM